MMDFGLENVNRTILQRPKLHGRTTKSLEEALAYSVEGPKFD